MSRDMAWARIDDGMPWHPKIIGLSVEARWAFVVGICYAARYLTDGVVPAAALDDAAGAELIKAGLADRWHGGYMLHDWHDWNPTASEVRERRAADAERKRRQRRSDDGRFT
jgi:hypothetical protein